MSNKKPDTKIIKNVMDAIISIGDKERKESAIYRKLNSQTSVMGVIEVAEHIMNEIVFATSDVLTEKFNIKHTNEKYHLLQALPKVLAEFEKDFEEKEGHVCCVDKAYHKLIKLLRE